MNLLKKLYYFYILNLVFEDIFVAISLETDKHDYSFAWEWFSGI